MKRPSADDARPAMELCEEAYHLLRSAPLSALGAYYVGAVPFCLALIYFANVMEVHPFAAGMLPGLSLLVAVLFVWMKAWQARYARILVFHLKGEEPPAWSPRDMLATAFRQGLLQLSAFIVLPMAMLLLFPLLRAYGFYQNLFVLDGDREQTPGALAREAYVEAQRWPLQAHLILWTLSPFLPLTLMGIAWVAPALLNIVQVPLDFGMIFLFVLLVFIMIPLSPLAFVLSINLIGLVALGAMLLKSLLDVDTIFTQAPNIMFGRAFLSVWMALLYLAMDPVLKAAYVLRCYYGRSLANGDDLRGSNRRLAQRAAGVALVLGSALLFTSSAHAQAPEPEARPAANVVANDLNNALRTELDGAAYQWRMPRDFDPEAAAADSALWRWMKSWGESFYNAYTAIRDWIKDRLKRLVERDDPSSPGVSGGAGLGRWISSAMELLLLLMLVVLLVGVLLFAYRQWRSVQQEGAELQATAAVEEVKIEDESTEATALPEDAWRRMADEFRTKGEYRLAMRALFLSLLSALAARELIAVKRYKSNAAYARELAGRLQRGHAALAAFRDGTLAYECVWYGEHAATPEGFDSMLLVHEQVRRA